MWRSEIPTVMIHRNSHLLKVTWNFKVLRTSDLFKKIRTNSVNIRKLMAKCGLKPHSLTCRSSALPIELIKPIFGCCYACRPSGRHSVSGSWFQK